MPAIEALCHLLDLFLVVEVSQTDQANKGSMVVNDQLQAYMRLQHQPLGLVGMALCIDHQGPTAGIRRARAAREWRSG